MDSFLNAVGIQRVLHRDLCERFQRNFAQRGNFLRHIAHVRRLIPAAADGFGRKVRAVRLNQDAVKRHIHRGFLQFRRFLEGHRPRKADEVPQFQVLLAISQLPEKQWMIPPVRCFLWRFMMSSMS